MVTHPVSGAHERVAGKKKKEEEEEKKQKERKKERKEGRYGKAGRLLAMNVEISHLKQNSFPSRKVQEMGASSFCSRSRHFFPPRHLDIDHVRESNFSFGASISQRGRV